MTRSRRPRYARDRRIVQAPALADPAGDVCFWFGEWRGLGGLPPWWAAHAVVFGMTCRDEVIAAFEALHTRTGFVESALAEVIAEIRARGSGYQTSTIRTHVSGRMVDDQSWSEVGGACTASPATGSCPPRRCHPRMGRAGRAVSPKTR